MKKFIALSVLILSLTGGSASVLAEDTVGNPFGIHYPELP